MGSGPCQGVSRRASHPFAARPSIPPRTQHMLSTTADRFFQRFLLLPGFLLAIGHSALAGALPGGGDY